MFLFSICVTVVVLNVHFRSPQTHKMAPWVKRVSKNIQLEVVMQFIAMHGFYKHYCHFRYLYTFCHASSS